MVRSMKISFVLWNWPCFDVRMANAPKAHKFLQYWFDIANVEQLWEYGEQPLLLFIILHFGLNPFSKFHESDGISGKFLLFF